MSYEQAYERKKKSSVFQKRTLIASLEFLFYMAVCFLISSLKALGGLTPFPFAILAVMCLNSRYLDKVSFVAVIGSYFAGGLTLAIESAGALAAFYVIHNVYKKPLSAQAVSVMAAVACLIAGVGTGALVSAPLIDYVYAVAEASLALLIAHALMAAYASLPGILNGQPKAAHELLSVAFGVSAAALGACGLFFSAYAYVYGGVVAFVSLAAACYLGHGEAAVTACLMGVCQMAAIGGGFEPIGIYCLAALGAFAVRRYKKYTSAFAYIAVYAVASYVVGSPLIREEIASAGGGAAAFLLFAAFYERLNPNRSSQPQLAAALANSAANRILLSEIESQKSMIREMQRNMTDSQPATAKSPAREASKMLAADMCACCERYRSCWHEDGERAYRAVAEVTRSYYEDSGVPYSDVEGTLDFCVHAPLLFKAICTLADIYRDRTSSQSRNNRFKGLMREQYSHLSWELDRIYSLLSRGLSLDGEGSEYALAMLNAAGLPADSIAVMEDFNNKKKVFVSSPTPLSADDAKTELPSRLAGLLGCDVFYDYEMAYGGSHHYVYTEEYRYKLITGAKSAIKEDYDSSGDTLSDVILANGVHMIALSDGMGSGEGAHRQSSRVLNMYEELVNAGFAEEAATEAVNSVLALNGDEELFVTLDLFLFDLEKGLGEYIKAGASPSYIKRGKTIEKVEMDSLPLGILDETQVAKEERAFQIGDTLYFMSDGFFDSFHNDEGLIREHISRYDYRNPQKIADSLYEDALSLTGGEAVDDITIVIARVR